MYITAKIDYACRAMLELSLHWPSKDPLQIQTIAQRQHIPIKFLTQILIQLKQLNYVVSTRGKHGGYLINMSPKSICVDKFVHDVGLKSCCESLNQSNQTVLNELWMQIDRAVISTMKAYTFEKLCDQHRKKNSAVMFNI